MKRIFIALMALMMAGAIALPAMAGGPNPTGGITANEVAKFNQFLDAHPTVAKQLQANPNLINDPNFLANHPHLHAFLKNHPGVRTAIHENPGQFMYREGHYQWHGHGMPPMTGYPGYGGAPYRGEPYHGAPPVGAYPGYSGPTTPGAHPYWHTDQYMMAHPEVAQQLEHNPKLVDNPNYVQSHPGLDQFLQRHPDARQAWEAHPKKYMHHEEKYQKHHNQPN
jgi:hypothetical protein